MTAYGYKYSKHCDSAKKRITKEMIQWMHSIKIRAYENGSIHGTHMKVDYLDNKYAWKSVDDIDTQSPKYI